MKKRAKEKIYNREKKQQKKEAIEKRSNREKKQQRKRSNREKEAIWNK